MYFYKLYQIKEDFLQYRNQLEFIIKHSSSIDLDLYYGLVFQFEAYRELTLEEFIKTVDNIQPSNYTGDDVFEGDIVAKEKEDNTVYYYIDKLDFIECTKVIKTRL